MTQVVTLGSNIRLVAIQFHVKTDLVPSVVPPYSTFHASPKNKERVGGRRVLNPTKDVLIESFFNTRYQLIDAWHAPCEDNWSAREVRYVFCHPDYVNPDKLDPNFVALRESLLASLGNLLGKNLWQTMGHLNPFFVEDKATNQFVLMLDCNSRKETVRLVPLTQPDLFLSDGDKLLTSSEETSEETEEDMPEPSKPEMVERPVMVYQGGRDKSTRKGIGPMIPLTSKASRLTLVSDIIVLEDPPSLPAPQSATI